MSKRRFKRGRATRDFMQLCLVLFIMVMLLLLIIFFKPIVMILGTVLLFVSLFMLLNEFLR